MPLRLTLSSRWLEWYAMQEICFPFCWMHKYRPGAQVGIPLTKFEWNVLCYHDTPLTFGVEGPLEYADARSSSIFERSLMFASISVTVPTLMTGANLIAAYFYLEHCYCFLLFRLDRVRVKKSLEIPWLSMRLVFCKHRWPFDIAIDFQFYTSWPKCWKDLMKLTKVDEGE